MTTLTTAAASAREEIESLRDGCRERALVDLRNEGHFAPVAAWIGRSDPSQGFFWVQAPRSGQAEADLEAVSLALGRKSLANEVRASVIAYDGRITLPSGGHTDAICLMLRHEEQNYQQLDFYAPYHVEDDEVVFDGWLGDELPGEPASAEPDSVAPVAAVELTPAEPVAAADQTPWALVPTLATTAGLSAVVFALAIAASGQLAIGLVVTVAILAAVGAVVYNSQSWRRTPLIVGTVVAMAFLLAEALRASS